MLGSLFDSLICRLQHQRGDCLTVETRYSRIRYQCLGNASHPCVLMVPDGPCVVEHFSELAKSLSKRFYVVVFDLPGFGFSRPKTGYSHSFEQVSETIEEVMNALQ